MSQVLVEPRMIPTCKCGSSRWLVGQRISRTSPLLRVDGFSDLVMNPPDPDTYQQAVSLACAECNSVYSPQAGIEAYYEAGGEDGFGWPNAVSHMEDEE